MGKMDSYLSVMFGTDIQSGWLDNYKDWWTFHHLQIHLFI